MIFFVLLRSAVWKICFRGEKWVKAVIYFKGHNYSSNVILIANVKTVKSPSQWSNVDNFNTSSENIVLGNKITSR